MPSIVHGVVFAFFTKIFVKNQRGQVRRVLGVVLVLIGSPVVRPVRWLELPAIRHNIAGKGKNPKLA